MTHACVRACVRACVLAPACRTFAAGEEEEEEEGEETDLEADGKGKWVAPFHEVCALSAKSLSA